MNHFQVMKDHITYHLLGNYSEDCVYCDRLKENVMPLVELKDVAPIEEDIRDKYLKDNHE